MIDAVVGAVIVLALFHGWRQGLVRQILSLVGLVVSIVAAFALSGPVADFLVDRVGMGPEVSRVVAPIVIFLAVGIAAALLERVLRPVVNLPVVGLANRLGGLVVAAAIIAMLLTLFVTVARVFPGGSDLVEDSTVLSYVADQGVMSGVLSGLAVDDSLERLGNLRGLLGDEVRAVPVGNETVPIPQARTEELTLDDGEATRIAAGLNVTRQRADRAPLSSSEGLMVIARDHAHEMATGGFLSRISPVNGTIADRFSRAGLPWVRSQIAVGMGATTRAVEEAFSETRPVQRMSRAAHFDRVGVAVLNGPHGIIVVQVLGG